MQQSVLQLDLSQKYYMVCMFCEGCVRRATEGLLIIYSSGMKSYLWK